MTTPRFLRQPIITGRSVGSILLLGLAIFMIASILMCNPAFHSATNLHRNSGTLDALDLGANVPETTRGSVTVVLFGAIILAGLWRKRPIGVSSGLAEGSTMRGVSRQPFCWSMRRPRLTRRARASHVESDDDASCLPRFLGFRTATTPWISAKPRYQGVLFLPATCCGMSGPTRTTRGEVDDFQT